MPSRTPRTSSGCASDAPAATIDRTATSVGVRAWPRGYGASPRIPTGGARAVMRRAYPGSAGQDRLQLVPPPGGQVGEERGRLVERHDRRDQVLAHRVA